MTDAALAINGLRYRHERSASGFELRVGGLEVAAGEDVLIVGESGEGKSTLLHLAAGLIEPDDGEVRIAGRAIHRLRGAERDRYRAAHIGMVFQTHHLLSGFTALENVMVALAFSDIPTGKHRGIAKDLLGLLGIERMGAMPDALSIGQQQRVAIARALAREPEVVLADEPTASLDPKNARAVIDMMRAACDQRGAALVCVSHDPGVVDRFSRVETLGDLRTSAKTASGAAAGRGAGVGD